MLDSVGCAASPTVPVFHREAKPVISMWEVSCIFDAVFSDLDLRRIHGSHYIDIVAGARWHIKRALEDMAEERA